MTEAFHIPVERAGVLETWSLHVDDIPEYRITLTSPHDEQHRATGSDLFRCLQHLRAQLEPHGMRICCKGSLRNAYPSPMGAEYGAWMVYVTPSWRGVTAFDLYPLFDPISPRNVATVEEQEWFRHHTLDRQKLHHLVRAVNLYGWALAVISMIWRRQIILRRQGLWTEAKAAKRNMRRARRSKSPQ